MDKSRYKRPPDVDEALSSMLWTPYDQAVNTSSSSNDSLSDDEREREKRKLNRYSNPLPSSLNWWNSHVSNIHPASLRYSFPFYGNYLPPPPPQQQHVSKTTTTTTSTKMIHPPHDNDNMNAPALTSSTASSLSIGASTTVTAKRIVALDTDNNSNGQTVNTSDYPSTMVHSFTDDFYQYQHQQTALRNQRHHQQQQNNRHSTHNNKNYKSQPSLLYNSNTQIIDTTHLVVPSTSNAAPTTSNITTLPMQFNHQRSTNVKTLSANIWQNINNNNVKTGNTGDPYSPIYVDVSRACMETSEKDTSRGNETLKTLQHEASSCGSNAPATKQISHVLNSNENTISSCSEFDKFRIISDENHEYRLLLLNNLITNRNMNGADECINNNKIYHNDNVVQMPLSLLSHNHHYNNPQMPSSSTSTQQQQQKHVQSLKITNPVSLTNVSNGPMTASHYDAAPAPLNVPCTSSVLSFQQKNNTSYNEYQMTTADMATKLQEDTECNNNSNSVNVHNESHIKMMNCVNVECYIKDNSESNNNNNNQPTTMTAPSADNLIITSAIETTTHGTPNKVTATTEKYVNDIMTMREKRRRDRRDRRLARTRALNGSATTTDILPDSLNNPRPPPYSSLPPQSIIPSIISTVPANDTRYIFSLPLVRRSTSDRSGKDCCGQWFNGPPLRFLVALVALGGVACTLGGATLGSIALAGSPTSHLTAGLLMTGVGIVLVTISGVAWRMTTSDAHQCTGRCGRRQCSRGNSSFGLLYPEFQHRPPPPSYQASMQEHRLRIMMLDRERQTSNARASPPPSYRSNAGTLLRPPIQFQRQTQQNGTVQVEIPVDESSRSTDESTTSSAEYIQLNQSPTSSSQTITTIASINRPDDNDNALSSMHGNVTSLIKLNEMTKVVQGSSSGSNMDTQHLHDVTLNCSRNSVNLSNVRSIGSSDSRCTSFTDRHNNCNKIFDHQQKQPKHHNHHQASNIDNARGSEENIECKNVNISNMTELNKALMSNSHVSTLPRSTQTRASFLDRDRCEMGIRSKMNFADNLTQPSPGSVVEQTGCEKRDDIRAKLTMSDR